MSRSESCPYQSCKVSGTAQRVLCRIRQVHDPNLLPADFIARVRLHQCSFCANWFLKLGQHSSQCRSRHQRSSQEQRERVSFTPHCGNVEGNVSSQASSAGTQPTPVSSTTFLDSALSQNMNLDTETTAWKYIRDLTVEESCTSQSCPNLVSRSQTISAYILPAKDSLGICLIHSCSARIMGIKTSL